MYKPISEEGGNEVLNDTYYYNPTHMSADAIDTYHEEVY